MNNPRAVAFAVGIYGTLRHQPDTRPPLPPNSSFPKRLCGKGNTSLPDRMRPIRQHQTRIGDYGPRRAIPDSGFHNTTHSVEGEMQNAIRDYNSRPRLAGRLCGSARTACDSRTEHRM